MMSRSFTHKENKRAEALSFCPFSQKEFKLTDKEKECEHLLN